MEVYQVGELFPHEKYCTGREQHVALPTDGFFNVLMSLNKISRKEKELFSKGRITAYLFEQRDIPFVVLDFGEGFSIDISFDTSQFDDETRRVWMQSETNIIALFLVEASTGILEAMRVIAVGFASEFREICARQAGQSGIGQRVHLVHAAFSTNEMMQHAIAKTAFK